MTESAITPRIEPLDGAPRFLQLGAITLGGRRFEIASRRKLDTRAVVPFFDRGGERFAGVVERERLSRALRGAPLRGLEAFSIDLSGADETGDIASLSESIFQQHTGLAVDLTRAPIALPSFARSIGYLAELCLPLLLPIQPPATDRLELKSAGAPVMRFLPLREALALLERGDVPHAEDLPLMLTALAGHSAEDISPSGNMPREASASSAQLLERWSARLATAEQLQPSHDGARLPAFIRAELARADELRFLKLRRVTSAVESIELLAPASGVSFALLPFVQTPRGPHFLLWRELRPSALERQQRAPLFDLPVSLEHVNATAVFLPRDEAARVASGDLSRLPALANDVLSRALDGEVSPKWFQRTGLGEPAPGVSGELRAAAAVELDADALAAISPPGDALLISASELSRAIAEGLVRDPVVVQAFLRLAVNILHPNDPARDPFARAREGEPGPRRAFLSALTKGSEVQRRLLGYSSIEGEQLAAPTYARVMTFLQHQHGLRIAYPKTEADRGFFKAAFRVFMAADRGDDDRALQGLHWSHDAFHFALGNFIVPPPPDFARWYASGEPAPAEQPPEGPAWDIYSRALKTAENEATFFSFWTLYDENLALAKHVGKLTYYEALRELGITDRVTARELYDAVVDRAELPERIGKDPIYLARADIQGLFQYMLGFRAYHFKDIAIAWRFATRDPYRGYLARFSIYEQDLAAYVENVRTFCARLAAMPRGLNPILCALAEARLDLNLRVWDVTKALRLLRAASIGAGQSNEARAQFLEQAGPHLLKLEALRDQLAALRAKVHDAEPSPRNEETLTQALRAAAELEQIRRSIWDWVESANLIAKDKLDAERVRELPR